MSRSKGSKGGAGAIQDKLLLAIGCLNRASRLLKQVDEDSNLPKLLTAPGEETGCIGEPSNLSAMMATAGEVENSVHSLLDTITSNLAVSHPSLAPHGVAVGTATAAVSTSSSSTVSVEAEGARSKAEEEAVEETNVKIIKKGSRELLSIMRSNQKINYENERHITYKKAGSAAVSSATSPEGRLRAGSADVASAEKEKERSKEKEKPKEKEKSGSKSAPQSAKKRKDALDEGGGAVKKPRVDKLIDTTDGEAGMAPDADDGGAGRRRWELRRMRLQDTNAADAPAATAPEAAKAAAGSGKSASSGSKKLDRASELATPAKGTPRRALSLSVAASPKSPAPRDAAGPNSAGAGSRPTLWASKKGKDNDKEGSGAGDGAATPVSATSWVCAVCTLENSMRARNCLACASSRSSSVRLPPGHTPSSSSAGTGGGVALDSAVEDSLLSLEDQKKVRTPRPHVPAPVVLLHPYREPKLGPEYQICEDALPCPDVNVKYDLRSDRYCPSGTPREAAGAVSEVQPAGPDVSDNTRPTGTTSSCADSVGCSDISNIYWEMVWFPVDRLSPDGSVAYIDVQSQYLDVLFPGCNDNRNNTGYYKDIDPSKRGKIFGGELEMEALRLLFRNRYNLRKALAAMDLLRLKLEGGVGGGIASAVAGRFGGRYGDSLVTCHVPGLFARADGDSESDSESGDPAPAAEAETAPVPVSVPETALPASTGVVMGDSGRIPKKPRAAPLSSCTDTAPAPVPAPTSSQGGSGSAEPTIVVPGAAAPPPLAAAATDSAPASFKSAVLALGQDAQAPSLLAELRHHMAMHWKDWNRVARAFAKGADFDDENDGVRARAAVVRVADLQHFYYSHFVSSPGHRAAKKETRAKFRRHSRAQHQKLLQLQKQSQKAQLLSSPGPGGASAAATVAATATATTTAGGGTPVKIGVAMTVEDSPAATALKGSSVPVCPILTLPPAVVRFSDPEISSSGSVAVKAETPVDGVGVAAVSKGKSGAVSAFGAKWDGETAAAHERMSIEGPGTSTEAKTSP